MKVRDNDFKPLETLPQLMGGGAVLTSRFFQVSRVGFLTYKQTLQ